MRARWKVILPAFGLIAFAILTHRSITENHALVHNDGRYFWWSGIRLDSDPLKCSGVEKNCFSDPIDVWVDPGWMMRLLAVSALPAFIVGLATVHGLAKLGVSEIVTFMISVPLLIVVWFYLVGWFLDRRRNRGRA
jgi:hypothetical protein